MADWLVRRYPEIRGVGDSPIRPGIVHRLDRDTSGVMIVARTQACFDYLKKLFAESKIKKTYLALAWGKVEPSTGRIDKPIQLKSGSTKRTVHKGKMSKPAVTEYERIAMRTWKVKDKEEIFSLLRVRPKTGRTHQIRIHSASMGHPLVGDLLYAPKRDPLGLSRQFLHAESIEWSDEGGRRFRFESELPDDLQKAWEAMGRIDVPSALR